MLDGEWNILIVGVGEVLVLQIFQLFVEVVFIGRGWFLVDCFIEFVYMFFGCGGFYKLVVEWVVKYRVVGMLVVWVGVQVFFRVE